MSPQQKILFTLWSLVGLTLAFYLGTQQKPSQPQVLKDGYLEVSLIQFTKIEGDQLEFTISGPGRVLWGEDQFVEGSGPHQLPLGQFADSQDLEFKNFPYTANTKTNKFYPSDSYPARGTPVTNRRFFSSKQAATLAGFIPTKLVK